MKFTKLFLLSAITILLLSCTTTGPKSALDNMADAMDKYNPAQFIANIDMKIFATNYVRELSQNDPALNSLNNIGELFGIGNLDRLLERVVDFQKNLDQKFNRGVASGELMAECRSSEIANCPWVPQSLRNAHIVQMNENAAIAQITTPAKMTSWLSLHKIDGKWQVVGQAVLENNARLYAAEISQSSKPKSLHKGASDVTNL